jgi:small multidrug resistance pump
MTALILGFAIASEVIATLALKASEGFWLLALVLKHLSVGTTYAVWSAVGTAAIALIGIVAYGEGANALKLASLGLIVLGVVGLNAAGGH